MNFYSFIKLYSKIKSPRLKLLGLLGLHLLHRRYLYILIDPSLSCNYRCRLCFFSNPEACGEMKGFFTEADIRAISDAVFHRCLRLQIGCGAEPTTYKHLAELVKLAHEKGVPFISITTNGSLLNYDKLRNLVVNGLYEITLSAHGFSKECYEYMMPGGSFDHFVQLLGDIDSIKKEFPHFMVRINYTFCNKNINDLQQLPVLFSKFTPDTIQLRPAQDIGGVVADDYSLSEVLDKYGKCIQPVIDFCGERHVTCIYPQPEQLQVIDDENQTKEHQSMNADMAAYFHLSPHSHWKEEFNPYKETFEQYAKRTHRVGQWFKMILGVQSGIGSKRESVTHALNYQVK